MKMNELLKDDDQPPDGCDVEDKPPSPWQDVPLAKWRDWRWQLSHRLRTVEDFAGVIHLTDEEIVGLSAPETFRVDVPPYFASLMAPDDPSCPIRRQVIPTGRELAPFDAELADSLGADGQPYLVEANTLPGLNPLLSDIVIAAKAGGVPYERLIQEIAALAIERYGLA